MEESVSILVLMELPLQRGAGSVEELKKQGFNPCFNGTTSATNIRILDCYPVVRVSILVLMELPLQLYNIYYNLKCKIVSILVLMELPLQHFIYSFTL